MDQYVKKKDKINVDFIGYTILRFIFMDKFGLNIFYQIFDLCENHDFINDAKKIFFLKEISNIFQCLPQINIFSKNIIPTDYSLIDIYWLMCQFVLFYYYVSFYCCGIFCCYGTIYCAFFIKFAIMSII